MAITVFVGTQKGAFLFTSDAGRQEWAVEGPLFKGWKVTAAARFDGRTFVATASDVYGAAIHVSDDLKSWRQIEKGPRYETEGKHKLDQIWRFARHADRLYAGVSEAGLFSSGDRGESWEAVAALNGHATRGAWQPGFGGLCAHAMLGDPKKPDRLWCGISAVGVFRSEDGGGSWVAANKGVPMVLEDETHKDIGYCVHALAADPGDANLIYRQDHKGMFRSRDGGGQWERIEKGLPSSFGFPLVIDPRSKALFSVPLESDEFRMTPDGKLRVFRSRDGGDSWQPLSSGLPQSNAHATVLRGALAVDDCDPCGVYFGTTSGTMYASSDLGESWRALPCLLPRILCVSALP